MFLTFFLTKIKTETLVFRAEETLNVSIFLTKIKTETLVFRAEETLNVCFLDSPNPEKWTMMNIRQWSPITTEWQMRCPAQCLTLSILSKCLQNQIVLCWEPAVQGLGRTNFYPKANIPL